MNGSESYAFIAPMYVLFSKNCRTKDAAVLKGVLKKKKYRELENFRFKNFECLNIRKNIYTIILYLKDKKMRKNCIYTQPD